MYRPNRIGPMGWFDGGMATTAIAAANADLIDLQISASAPYSYIQSATVPVDRNHSFLWSESLSIDTIKWTAFAVPISGVYLAKGMLLTVDCYVSFNTDGQPIIIQGFIGQLNNSTILVTHAVIENLSTFFRPLGVEQFLIPGTIPYQQARIRESIFWSQEDDSAPADENPIVVGFSLMNPSGTRIVMGSFHLFMSIHRYIEDIQLFDPNRG